MTSNLRLGHPPTLSLITRHLNGAGGEWLVRSTGRVTWARVLLAPNRFPEGDGEIALLYADGIALDGEGQPCPVGGWPPPLRAPGDTSEIEVTDGGSVFYVTPFPGGCDNNPFGGLTFTNEDGEGEMRFYLTALAAGIMGLPAKLALEALCDLRAATVQALRQGREEGMATAHGNMIRAILTCGGTLSYTASIDALRQTLGLPEED